jgi:hypothetical protein
MTIHERCACGAEIKVFPDRMGYSDRKEEQEEMQKELTDWRDRHTVCIVNWGLGVKK